MNRKVSEEDEQQVFESKGLKKEEKKGIDIGTDPDNYILDI